MAKAGDNIIINGDTCAILHVQDEWAFLFTPQGPRKVKVSEIENAIPSQ